MLRTRSRSRGRSNVLAVAAKVTVLGLLAAILVVVPAPRVEAVETMVVDTTTPVLRSAGGSAPSAAQVLVAGGEDVGEDLADPTRLVAREEVERFDMLGVTLPEQPDEHVLARARVDGRWGRWMELELNPEHTPDGPEARGAEPGSHSAPVWVEGADAYELNLPASVASVEVHLVRPEVREVTIDTSGDRAGAAESPPILSRSQWGARAPEVEPVTAPDLKMAVVHHSVNANSYSRGDVPAMLRGIQAYHMDAQGWNDIAYNFAVDRFGRIWEARAGGVDRAVVGGHSRGFNTYTTGVMVLGDFSSATPPQASVDAVAEVIGWKFARHKLEVRGTTQFTSLGGPRYSSGTVLTLPKILSHRDVGVTSCPGSQLYRRLGEIRTKAAGWFDHYVASQPETPLFGDFDGDGRRDILRYRPGSGADVLWSRPGDGIRRSALTIAGTYRPVVGDYDGDGRDDVFWYAPGSAPGDRIWYGGPGGFTSRVVDVPEHGLPHVAELDGDGRDDLIVYAPGGSPDRIYSGGPNRTIEALPLAVDGTFDDLVVGDFDGDQRDDLIWYNAGSGSDHRWFSNGRGSFTPVATEIDGVFHPVVGDFDGSGRDDVLWYAPGAAADELWWSEIGIRGSTTVVPQRIRGTSYLPQVGDVDGNGTDDVMWYQPGPGSDPIWMWNALRIQSDRIAGVGGAYVPDLGRYTADALDDIAWVAPSGASYLWVATGGATFRSVTLG